MFSSLWKDIKKEFTQGTMVSRLLLVNCAVFAAVVMVGFLDWGLHHGSKNGWSSELVQFFAISSDWRNILKHLWSPITCLFLHEDFGHILFNMFALMMFGNIVGDLIGDKKILPIYLMGGLLGNLFFFIAYAILSLSGEGMVHSAIGASGAIMALAATAVTLAPNYNVRLLLLGQVKLKFVVVFMLLADLFSIAQNVNTGGHFAHLGGFFFGWFFVTQLQQGKDMSIRVNDWIDGFLGLFKRKKNTGKLRAEKVETFSKQRINLKGSQENKMTRPPSQSHQERIDTILDKIKEKGYDNLSQEDKDYLFQASKKD